MSLLETVEITTDDHPQAAVIWMHGLGADGNDFVPIVRELDLSDCPARPHTPCAGWAAMAHGLAGQSHTRSAPTPTPAAVQYVTE
jgi:predicted esterase